VINSLLWDNRDPIGITGITNLTATVTLTNSLVHNSGGSGGGWISDPSLIDGGGNIDQVPLFVTPVLPSETPTTAGNLRLASGSPAVDVGLNDYPFPLPVDLDGNNRKQDGDGDGIATVDMGAYESPTAYKLMVGKTGTGSGLVDTISLPPVINCGTVCEKVLVEGTQLTLTAAADTGSVFDGWSGACSDGGDCALTMESAKIITASFTLSQYTLSVSVTGDGSGKVTSQPAGIDCGSDCSYDYDYNQKAVLIPVAAPGSTFTGWSGACSGAGTCEVTMAAARSVGAEFSLGYGISVFLPLGIR
jgi:hypothetical protein